MIVPKYICMLSSCFLSIQSRPHSASEIKFNGFFRQCNLLPQLYRRKSIQKGGTYKFSSPSAKNFLPGAPHCCFILDRFRNREIPYEYAWVQLKEHSHTKRSCQRHQAIIIIPIVQNWMKRYIFLRRVRLIAEIFWPEMGLLWTRPSPLCSATGWSTARAWAWGVDSS
jgi:hypothetical protein